MASAWCVRIGRQGAAAGLVCIGLLLVVLPSLSGAAGGEYLGSFGPDGTENTEFEAPGSVAVDQESGSVYLLERQDDAIYKFDSTGIPSNFEGSAAYISGNKITGLDFNNANGSSQVAVDSETHVIYVTSDNKVRAFESSGEPHLFTAGPGEGTSEIPGATTLAGVTTDRFGNIYASDRDEKKIRIYTSSGAMLTEFTPETTSLSTFAPTNLSVSPEGTLYVSKFIEPVFRFDPSEVPITSDTDFGRGTQVDDAHTFAVSVDPTTSYVYIGEAVPAGDTLVPQVAVYDRQNHLVGTLGGPGQPGEFPETPVGVAVLGTEERAYVSVVAEIAEGPQQVEMFRSFSFTKGPPTIGATFVTDVTSQSAQLRARINPNTFETTYWFEYGPTDCVTEPNLCTKVPLDGAAIGSGHEFVAVLAVINSLEAGAKYYYRVVAENSQGTEKSPTRAFSTQVAQFGSQLADERVWEQVTPGNKFGGSITNAGLVQASQSGSGIAFQTRGSIVEDPEGNRALETSAVLARRGASGWSTDDLVPRHTEAGGLGFGPEFKLFSEDLEHAVFEPRDDTPLSPESSERAPYLRTNTDPPGFRPLVTSKEGFANVPPGTVFGGEANGDRNPVSVSGANSALTHIALTSKAPLVEGAQERSLYLWHDGSLEPVSELPAGEGGGVVRAQLGSGTISVRHAVSEDGSRVFWAPGDPLTVSLDWPALYLRDTGADETVRLDVPESDASGAGEAHPAFMNASVDGSIVFFTDSQQLTSDASPEGRDLYRCEIGDVGGSLGCVDIQDLSAPLDGSGENGEARELALGVSEDGDTIYFVAKAILDSGANAADEEAVAGGPNLYIWQKGHGVRLVAPLSSNDSPDWGVFPSSVLGHGSRVGANTSPDGRYLSFMSERNLTGAESDDPETGQPVEQAFLYDAVEDELRCISCSPDGSTTAGHLISNGGSEGGVIFPDPQQLWFGKRVGATLPESSEGEPTSGFALYWPRGVLDNGRAYFNSTNPLVNGDSNGTWDVYQYEPFGTGDCDPSAGSAMVATTEAGCVALMSAGTDSSPSIFLDASGSGEDVFFATSARLSALDTDTNVDIYDARVGGVEAVAEQPSECSGEACQPKGLPPGEAKPKSATFNGAGNVNQKPKKHCRKGQKKVKRHGKVKCVKKHKKQKQSSKSGRGA